MADAIEGPGDGKGKKSNAGKEYKPKDMQRPTHAPVGSVGMPGPGGSQSARRQLTPDQAQRAQALQEARQNEAKAEQARAARKADKAETRDILKNGKNGRTTYHQRDFERASKPPERSSPEKTPPEKSPPSRDGRSR